MAHHLDFETLLTYDIGELGITVAVRLELPDKSASFNAKIDTGADHCIFERKFGEELGLKIETGSDNDSERSPELSWPTVTM